MKRILAMLLVLATVFSMAACGGNTAGDNTNTTSGETTAPTTPETTVAEEAPFSIPEPMKYPTYTFDHTPTTDELRQMAIKALMDFLSVPWYTENKIVYNKTGAASGKKYIYQADTSYCGLPYTNGDKGLFQFLEHYDFETGKLLFDGNAVEFNQLVGGTCACGVMWSWAAVCDSLDGLYVNYNMVYKYGCIPVGDYTYDFTIDSYQKQLSTQTICKNNGKDTIFSCYAQMLPADAVTSSPDNHTMMVIEKPHVVYNEDGTIDGVNSYVMIADQRGGGSGDGRFYELEVNGETRRYSGRISAKYTFNELFKLWYIPVTTAEFMGQDPYKAPEVKFSLDNYTTVEQLVQGEITSNFPICVVKLNLVDADGNVTNALAFQTDKNDVYTGLARKFPLETLSETLNAAELEKLMDAGKNYTLKVDVTVSNGQIFTVAELPMTKS